MTEQDIIKLKKSLYLSKKKVRKLNEKLVKAEQSYRIRREALCLRIKELNRSVELLEGLGLVKTTLKVDGQGLALKKTNCNTCGKELFRDEVKLDDIKIN